MEIYLLKRILFDNAGGSQCLKIVGDRIRDYLFQTNVQLGASYEVSQHSNRRVQEGRKFLESSMKIFLKGVTAMATFINANHPKEICLSPSSTQVISKNRKQYHKYFENSNNILIH
jgi:selenocysteine lyase/cysteine desulfurase